jgi:hypothetical protein
VFESDIVIGAKQRQSLPIYAREKLYVFTRLPIYADIGQMVTE